MILNFSDNSQIKYSIKCTNKTNNDYYFYLFQRMDNQSNNEIFSVVWMLSPYKISNESYVKFIWSKNLSFFWLQTGKLEFGQVALSGGLLPILISTKNHTEFNIENKTPKFSEPTTVLPNNNLVISSKDKVPNSVFSTGIGMSNYATFIEQSYTNTTQYFSDKITFWVAVTINNIELTQVLRQNDIPNSSNFTFPVNKFSLNITLNENNLWEID